MPKPKVRKLPDDLWVDNFAGAGGASTGIRQAIGREVDIAINHSRDMLAVHIANHPGTRHLLEDVFDVDPEEVTEGRSIEGAWFSPDCTHHSRAKGAKPVDGKLRGLAWVAVRWARVKRPKLIFLENVAEFQTWGPLDVDNRPCPLRKGQTFRRFINTFKRMGYAIEYRVLNCADYGVPTNRKRLFVIARCDGRPICWPEPTYGPGRAHPYHTAAECIDWSIPCPSIFERKRPLKPKTLRRIAMGIVRYVINNPKPFLVQLTHSGGHRIYSVDDPMPTTTGANRGETALVSSIVVGAGGAVYAGKPRPVDEPLNTVLTNDRRALVAASLVQLAHGDGKGKTKRWGKGSSSVEQPIGVIHAGGKNHALVSAFLTQHYGGHVGIKIDQPCGTITGCDHHSLTTATLMKFRGDSAGSRLDDPMPTITAGAGAKRPAGAPHALGLAACNLIRMNHGDKQWNAVDDPLGTITGQGNKYGLVYSFLVKHYSQGGQWQSPDQPLDTITSKDRFGIVLVWIDGEPWAIADIGMRMLSPHELAAAQGFPPDYALPINPKTGLVNKTKAVKAVGNSVPPGIVKAIVQANLATVRYSGAGKQARGRRCVTQV